MVRTPSFDKNGMKKGAWSSEEDDKLKSYMLNYGHWKWRELPKFAGLKRCGKSCRLRWMNYLRPDLKHENYTKEEDQLIIQLHQKHGNKWAEIASKLPGRTDNEIKNHWHTHLKKRVGFQKSAKIRNPASDDEIADSNSPASDHIQILESCPLSSSEMPPSSSAYTTSSDISSSNFDISNASDFFDDGGLEEMMNSAHLFAEMSSLLSPMNQQAPTHHDHHPSFNDGGFGIKETPITMGDIYGEHDQDDLWGKALLSDTYNELLLSPCVNYLEEIMCSTSSLSKPCRRCLDKLVEFNLN